MIWQVQPDPQVISGSSRVLGLTSVKDGLAQTFPACIVTARRALEQANQASNEASTAPCDTSVDSTASQRENNLRLTEKDAVEDVSDFSSN